MKLLKVAVRAGNNKVSKAAKASARDSIDSFNAPAAIVAKAKVANLVAKECKWLRRDRSLVRV